MGERSSAAFRLNEILKRFRKQDAHKSLQEGWKKVLGVADDAAFFEGYAKVVRLLSQVRPEIGAIGDGRGEMYMKAINKVENVFRHSLGGPAQNAFNELDDTTMALMQVAAYHCQENAPEYSFDTAQLDMLQQMAEKLIDALKASDLPDGFKAVLISHLSAIIAAIRDFDIFGVEPIQKSVEAAVGAVAVAVSQEPERKNNERVKEVMTFLRDTLTTLSVVKTTIDIGKQIAEHVMPLLA